MSSRKRLIPQADFLLKYNVLVSEFAACGLTWDDCNAIHSEYVKRFRSLDIAMGVLHKTLEGIDNIHLVKSRVKDPEHLVSKVVRKNIEALKSGFRVPRIDLSNFDGLISDQIGVRGIHLFKTQFPDIHGDILKQLDVEGVPEVWVTNFEPQYVLDMYERMGLKPSVKTFGYRSVHYKVKIPMPKTTFFAELQIRTIYEEAWGEIDHVTRYPHLTADTSLQAFTLKISSFSGQCDQLGDVSYKLSHIKRRLSDPRVSMETKEQLLNSMKDILASTDLK